MEALKIQKLVKNELIDLLEKDITIRQRLYHSFIEDSDLVTKTYLDIQLAKLAKAFDRKLEESVKSFKEELKESTKSFKEELKESTKAFKEELKESTKAFKEELKESTKSFDKKLEAQTKSFKEELKESTKAFDKKLEAQTKSFADRLRGLGGRWGKDTESAFREGMKSILEKEFKAKVKHWHYKGKISSVHPRREEYELDLVISDGKLILIEIKGSVYPAQVETFDDNIKAYEFINKTKATRKLIITPYADLEAIEIAKKFNIEIISPPLEYYEINSGS